jgi:DNA-binding PadR family transcriptional regulator
MTGDLPPHWFHILLALGDGPRHGLAIIDDIADRTGGRVRLWPGVLYVALKKMTAEGLIADAPTPADFVATAGRPRFFKLTALGRRRGQEEANYLASIVASARSKRLLKREGR